MKKSRTALIICLIVNVLAEICFPFVLIAVIFTVRNNVAVWAIVLTMLAVVLASAVISNVAAGYNLSKRWYAIPVPPLTFFLTWFFMLNSHVGFGEDSWIAFAATAILLAVTLTSALVTASRQKKKQAANDCGEESKVENNDETV